MVLSVVIIILSSSLGVYADTEESYTRLEICKKAAQIFEISPDGDITPLLAYNDWASAPAADRYIVASVLKSGIFVPDTDGFLYDTPMTEEDYDRLTFGLTLYAMRIPGYNFISGTLTSINVKSAVVTDNYGAEYKFSSDVPVIKGEKIVNTFSEISAGASVEVVFDDEGSAVIAWAKRQSAPTVKHFEKGTLYVYDEINNNLIFKDLSVLRSGSWVKADRYLSAAVCDETLIIHDSKKAELKDINRDYLDKTCSIIVGEKNGQPCILYLLFD